MKWLVLGLVVVGGFFFLSGMHMDSTASFEGGTFIYEILQLGGGLAVRIVGVGMILVEMFSTL